MFPIVSRLQESLLLNNLVWCWCRINCKEISPGQAEFEAYGINIYLGFLNVRTNGPGGKKTFKEQY